MPCVKHSGSRQEGELFRGRPRRVYCFAESNEPVCCPLALFRSFDLRMLERWPLRRRIRFLDQRIQWAAEAYAEGES
jgi:hypothetical protein